MEGSEEVAATRIIDAHSHISPRFATGSGPESATLTLKLWQYHVRDLQNSRPLRPSRIALQTSTGNVDIVNFGIFSGFFGEPDTLADLDDSGMVDILDFGIFAANFDAGSAPQPLTPEPTALVVLGVSGLLLTRRRRST